MDWLYCRGLATQCRAYQAISQKVPDGLNDIGLDVIAKPEAPHHGTAEIAYVSGGEAGQPIRHA